MAPKVEYGVREIYVDLLNFSARHLATGGRLAFWLPVNRSEGEGIGLIGFESWVA